MVRLKEIKTKYCQKIKRYFNSIMVRLKVFQKCSCNNFVSFQFHYGTIKRVFVTSNALLWEANFNSIMVRLKVLICGLSPSSLKFQFHYGTIKSIHSKDQHMIYLISFQFHYGTIKRTIQKIEKSLDKTISIPLWYD